MLAEVPIPIKEASVHPPMTRRAATAAAAATAVIGLLALPAIGMADEIRPDGTLAPGIPLDANVNTFFVLFAATLVIFMQAGFLLLEVGFSRGKNVGTIVAKILTNFSIAAIGFWACGFAIAFGAEKSGLTGLVGTDGFFLRDFGDPATAFPVMGIFNPSVESKFLFQFAFCAVSLAIVWGTTLERIKFGVYIIYAIVFSTIIYPLGAHWVFGGGFLQTGDWLGTGIVGMQDFAGSTAVHLIGATGGLAALLVLGPRRGKYAPDGSPRPIPGHSMPLFGLGVIILLIGWVGFNGGTALGITDNRAPEIVLITFLAAAGGVLGSIITAAWKTKTIDIGMAGNGMIGGLVAITAPSGYIETWPAPIIGFIAGVIVPLSVYAIDKKLDDPVGALSAHGVAGIWGTISCGIFTAPRFASYNAFGDPAGGLVYSGSFAQLIAQVVGFAVAFTMVFVLSYATFWLINKTYGMRVSPEEEEAGLDISEHGMYGYPEQFIPEAELVGYGLAPNLTRPETVSATTTTQEA